MIRTGDELRRLATPEFSRLLNADPELCRLQELKYERSAECALLLEVLSFGELRIGRLPVLPLTAAKWSLFWLLESPFVFGGKPTETDCSVALYILHAKDISSIPGALHEIPALASGFIRKTGADVQRVAAEIRLRRDIAFRPLALLPPEKNSSGEAIRFDTFWLTRIAGITAKEANVTLTEAMHRLPLAILCSCFVNYLLRTSPDADQIRRRPNAELAQKISARIARLEENFLSGGK